MIRNDYLNQAKDILVNKNPYGKYHKENLEKYNYGEMTPVNSDILLDMPTGYKIKLNEEVYEALDTVQSVTKEGKFEVAFLLFGQIDEATKEIFFNNASLSRKGSNSNVADFEDILPDIEKYVNQVRKDKIKNGIVCHGHSHPENSQFYKNFSLGDLTSYIEMNEVNTCFKNKEIELCSCLLEDGNYDFLFYDNNVKNFYKFNDVYAKDRYGYTKKLDCYNSKEKTQDEI